jgi:hypothetical protein
MDSYFILNDIDSYAKHLRHCVASNLKENYSDNLDEYITIDQLKKLILEKCNDTDELGNTIITEDINQELFEITSDWIYGVGLSRLASIGLIGCCWNSETNTMEFWNNEYS